MTYSMSVSVSDKFSLYTLMYFVLIFDIFISNSDPSGIDLLTTIVAFFLFRFLHIHLNWPHLFDQLPYMTNLIRQTQLPSNKISHSDFDILISISCFNSANCLIFIISYVNIISLIYTPNCPIRGDYPNSNSNNGQNTE